MKIFEMRALEILRKKENTDLGRKMNKWMILDMQSKHGLAGTSYDLQSSPLVHSYTHRT